MTDPNKHRIQMTDDNVLSLRPAEDGVLMVETYAGTEVGFERASERDYSVFMKRSGDVWTFNTESFETAFRAFKKAIKSPQAFRMACDIQ